MTYTIDTNILIYHGNADKGVTEFFADEVVKGSSFVLPTIVLVEFFGFSEMTLEAKYAFDELFPYFTLAPLDYKTALIAARFRSGKTLKLADSIIAATALVTNSILVTRNVSDFKKVPSLEIQSL